MKGLSFKWAASGLVALALVLWAVPAAAGYWLVSADGAVFSFGTAKFYGSVGGVKLAKPIVGMAASSDGKGYRLVSSDGGVFVFGDARFAGSVGNVKLSTQVVGLAATPDEPAPIQSFKPAPGVKLAPPATATPKH